MKRMLSFIMTIVFILAMAAPANGAAVKVDKAMENAIKTAKTKFTIPQSYKFDSSIGMEGSKKIFYLNWRSTDAVDTTSINVRIDENGTILGYSKYSPYDYTQIKKLPKLSRQDAIKKAEGYITKIDSGLLKKLQYEDNYQASIMDTSYFISYYRMENGVPFYNDRVSVSINRETGELQDFSRQWTDKITFPSAKDPLPLKDAEAAYAKNIGLRLIYKYSYNEEQLKTYAVYVPIYDNANYAIDAFTGERKRLMTNYYYGYGDQGMYSMNQKAKFTAAEEVKLNPDELKAAQDAAKLMTIEEAEKIVRETEFLNLSSECILQNYNLSTNWPSKDEYIYSLQFVKKTDDTTNYDVYTNVSINAKTGIITEFYRGADKAEDTKPKNDMETAKKEVDEFLVKYYPEYNKQLEYEKLASENSIYKADEEKSTSYNFVYSRLVNGVPFPENGISVNYDNISGTIIGFNLNWFDTTFPAVDKVIGITAASEKLFANVGLGLEYKYEYNIKPDAIKMGNVPDNSKVLLVYSLKPNKPLFIDANSGILLGYDGIAYKEPVRVSYTDIKGNAAEKQIMVLAENGIYLEGAQFKPDTAITQLDFLALLSKTLSYYGPVITAKSSGKEIDELYGYLQREGIVKAGEKAPKSNVTREDAVKFIIRAMKYDKVADIKGIYNCTFKDKGSISKNLAGYATIAGGLGIVNNTGYFKPKAKLTRGETAVMIYNYLQV